MSITVPTGPAETTVDPAVARMVGLAAAAATAAAPLVPAGVELVPGPAQEPSATTAGWTAGAAAALSGAGDVVVGLLVATELADALATAPTGALDLGAALQPAIDGAAAALGAAASAARPLAGEELAAIVGAASVAVPLLAGEEVAAVLFLGGAVPAVGTAAPGATPLGAHGLTSLGAAPTAVTGRGVELLHGVAMEVTVELGRTRLAVRELLALSPGDVLELDRAAGSPADLLVNGRLIARGEVVVVDEAFALRVTEIVAHSAAV